MTSDKCLARVFLVGDPATAFVCRKDKGHGPIHTTTFVVEIVEENRIEPPQSATVNWYDSRHVDVSSGKGLSND